MRKIGVAFLLVLAACGGRYVGWEQVRIEEQVPSSSCKRVMQEACSQKGANCFNWYKQRATIYNANTVVVTQSTQGSRGKIGAWGGSYGSVTNALADYYVCPVE